MTTTDLQYHINLVDKAVEEFEIINSNLEGSFVDKMLTNITSRYREIIREIKGQCMW